MEQHDFSNYPELTNSQMRDFYYLSPHRQITESFSAEVVNVHDGDTILVRWSDRSFDFPVRFADTFAPELNEGGVPAQRWMEERILGKVVDVVIDPKNRVEKWGRLLGRIYEGGINVGKESSMLGLTSEEAPWD